MNPNGLSNEQVEVWTLLQAMNRAWLAGEFEGFERFFHPDVVIIAPGFQERSEGRVECVASYQEFAELAEIHDYQEIDPQIDVTGSTAVVSYTFDINYTLEDEENRDIGQDLFVLTREDGAWRIVWRTLVPFTFMDEDEDDA